MDSLGLSSFDILVLIILGLSALYGVARGFTSEALSLGAWVGAGFATIYGLPHFRPLVREHVDPDSFADILAVVVLGLVSLILFKLLGRAIGGFVRQSSVGAIDRGLGALFGLARGVFIVSVAYLLITWIIPKNDLPGWIEEARTRPLVEYSASVLSSVTPAEIAEEFDEVREKTLDPDLVEKFKTKLPDVSFAKDADNGKGYTSKERQGLEGLIDDSDDSK
ncbi:MAG: hypothetical protein D6763_04010 [Alphaproteobacteria bacterium]|nr:MAG: hypothetical protein D6763_04010 [Alphaproteobacteria bacterium]